MGTARKPERWVSNQTRCKIQAILVEIHRHSGWLRLLQATECETSS